VGLASPSYAAYAVSKAAVEALTRVLARELRGRDITVNAVAPGLEPSPTAAEVAGLVAFLAGPEGRLVSGQVISAPALLRQPSAAGRAHDGVDRPASLDRGA
jgi:3-oxoacyl-[acyl-carrier protein] reductase